MIIKAENPFAKYLTIDIDGEIQHPFVQYNTTLKVAALGKDETDKLLGWDIGRVCKAKLTISESYEITPGIFVRDVQADFHVQIAAECPPRIRDQILK